MTMKFKGLIFIMSVLFLIPTLSFASTVLSQTSSSVPNASGGLSGVVGQRLGNNLTGYVTSFDMKFKPAVVNGATVVGYFASCADSSYTTGCINIASSTPVDFTVGGLATSTVNFPFVNGSTGVVLNSSLYYYFYITDFSNNGQVWGCTPSCYSAGSSFGTFSGNMPSDFYFVLYGLGSNSVSGQFDIVSPTQNQNTSSGFVTLTTSYYYNSVSDNFDKIGFTITDVTHGQLLLPQETTISSSGQSTYSVVVSLATSTQYIVKAYLRSTTASSTTIYSSSRSFCVVACPTGSGMSYLPSTSLPSSSDSTYQGYATTTYGVATTSGGIGSTTISTFNLGNLLPADLNAVLRSRFPFSYLYDAFLLISELAGGTKVADPTFTLPLGAVITNPVSNATSSTFTLINTNAVVATGYVSNIRTILSYSIYMVTALYLIGVIMSSF